MKHRLTEENRDTEEEEEERSDEHRKFKNSIEPCGDIRVQIDVSAPHLSSLISTSKRFV